jgi:type IV pilus assembly protein PilV
MIRVNRNGFSLIEVLVSMLVVALGVIGAAGMQMTALRTSHQSGFQTLAVQLASEMADKMRANDNQMKQGAAANPFLAIDYRAAADGEPAAPGKLCYASECDGEELAAFDIYEWKKRVKAALPAGRAIVCRDSMPWDSKSNALTWNCSPGADDNASLVIKLGWQSKNPDGSLIKDADNAFPPSVALTVEPYIR